MEMKARRHLACAVVLVFVLAHPCNAAGISGITSPLSRVTLHDGFDALEADASTDGRFSFEDLPSGIYLVTSTRPGFLASSSEVIVSTGASSASVGIPLSYGDIDGDGEVDARDIASLVQRYGEIPVEDRLRR
jgi:hypothetical protein